MTDPELEDAEFDPAVEPNSSKAWLNRLENAEKAFEDYQRRADNIDKLYSDLTYLAGVDKERSFALFWSNVQVLGPSIYARPPVPVVVPKFKDRRPLYRVSSELMERATVVAFDLTNIDEVMVLLRDDLNIVGRGSPWVRYETKKESGKETERVCIEHKDRKDFLHEPARKWADVGWVAGAAYLSRKEMRKRFAKTSGKAYRDAAFAVQKDDKDNGAADASLKCKVWEIWSKTENKVVWVTEGVDVLLDEGEPHLKLENFFPCPKPVYATVQRRSLVPVPDIVFYKDQLEEINELTARIHVLSDALKVRGFYPAGMGEAGDAIEAAIKSLDNRQILVPISNWAAFGNAGEPIIWLPIDMISQVVAGLVELRRNIIDDVYQIMGLSDIMRGSSEKEETLGAQQLKAQFGSVRIRDKKNELVRVARDLVRIAAEIIAENFDKKTLVEMSQLELPTDAGIAKQVKELEAQAKHINGLVEKAKSDPEMVQQAQQNPEQAQQMMQQAQGQVQQLGQQVMKLKEEVTIDQVMEFLRDQKTKPFVLDIETDSTIAPDEQAEKESRNEFMQALGALLQQFLPLLQQQPQAAGMVGEMIKFALAPYRAGRELEGKIDETIEQMIAQAGQPQPNPEAEAAQAEQQLEQQRMQFEMQKFQAEQQNTQADLQFKAQAEQQRVAADIELKSLDARLRQQESQAKLQQIAAQMERDERKGALEMRKLEMEMAAQEQELIIKAQSARIDQATQLQSAEIQANSAEQQASLAERSFAQKQAEGRP